MKKSCSFLLVIFLLSLSTMVAEAQTRQRRVGSATPSKQGTSSTTTTAQPPSTQGSPTPARPPVLGGANYPNNRQPTVQESPAKTGPEEVDAGDVIRVNTTLVTIPVSVMDRDGRYVPNLKKEDFRLWEDGVEQQVAFFSSVDKPFSVVLMIDTSGSTRFRLEDIQDAAINFVNQLRPDDKVMVVSFNDDIRILADFTSDRARLQRAIRHADTGDGTRLYDAVDMVINQQLSRVSGRKAIVLFTDGVDTTSRRANYQSNVTDSEELDALIYPVQYDTFSDISTGVPTFPGGRQDDVLIQVLGGIFGGGRGGRRGGRGGPTAPGTSRSDYDIANRYLRDLAQNTGGRGYQADSMQNLSQAFANVAEELRRQYSIGYYPKRSAQAGQRRQIRVRANQPNLAVKARDSYIFNPSGTVVPEEKSAQKNAPVLRRFTESNQQFPNR
jgi:VWFA-related protein